MRGSGGLLLGAALAFVGQAAMAQDVFCGVRNARSDKAWAVVLVRADKTTEQAFAGRGDHCDVQEVDGRVLRTIKGPLKADDPVRFMLSQGACGDPRSVNDEFTAPTGQLVVLLERDVAGGIYQSRAETPAVYAAKEKACGR